MGFTIIYRPLCHINIWHGYYLHPPDLNENTVTVAEQNRIIGNPDTLRTYTILNDLEFKPTIESQSVLRNYRIVFRQVPTGFVLFIQATVDGTSYTPFIPLHEALETLRFFIIVKNASFYNFTNLSQQTLKRNFLLFSNGAGNRNEDTGTLFLNPERPTETPHYVTPGNSPLIEKDPGDASLSERNLLGFIDIHLNSTALNHYALTDAEEVLQNPTYTLWWQNRVTRWRYLFNQDQDPPTVRSDVDFENDNPRQLISKRDIPLLHRNRSVSYIQDSQEILLPNPGEAAILPEDGVTYSEIYMGDTKLI